MTSTTKHRTMLENMGEANEPVVVSMLKVAPIGDGSDQMMLDGEHAYCLFRVN